MFHSIIDQLASPRFIGLSFLDLHFFNLITFNIILIYIFITSYKDNTIFLITSYLDIFFRKIGIRRKEKQSST